MHISRHYSDHHIKHVCDTFEIKLAVYEDQIRGWFHDQARILQRVSANAGFVILLVVVSYIEHYAIYSKGKDSKGQSKVFFREAFKDIFEVELSGMIDHEAGPKIINDAVDELYHQVRCGLFHTGITRGKVFLSKNDIAVCMRVDANTKEVVSIGLNPSKMMDRIEDHFSDYVIRLRDPSQEELRKNFEKAWSIAG
ncbi:MAG: hypothetical protein GVY30_10440 [Chloroflexi bacterium]|nr:hypothetical protein [Chloroflexota bacterium]